MPPRRPRRGDSGVPARGALEPGLLRRRGAGGATRGRVVAFERFGPSFEGRPWIDELAALSRRVPVVLVIDPEATSWTHWSEGSRKTEMFDPARRAADARGALGDAVPVLVLDAASRPPGVPPWSGTLLVVDADGRVVFV